MSDAEAVLSQLSEVELGRLERIANLVAQGVSFEQVAACSAISLSDLVILMATEEYLQMASLAMERQLEEQEVVNRGWDGLEEKALGNLHKIIDRVKDPDTNLRIAAVANRASRRGLRNAANAPQLTAPQNEGARVVIQLNTQFVQQVSELRTARPEISELAPAQRKIVNMMSVTAVEKVLGSEINVQVDGPAMAKMLRDGQSTG